MTAMITAKACAWRRRGDARFCARSPAIRIGEDFDGGRLVLYARFCEYHERLAAQTGVPSDLVPEDRPPSLLEFELVRPDPVECAHWILDRHVRWGEVVQAWLARIGVDAPAPQMGRVHAKAMSAAGVYFPASHTCDYVLPYAMSQRDYDQTIAHEVCHGFQRELHPGCSSHGEAFEVLFRRAAGITVEQRECAKYNAYDAQLAIELGKSVVAAVQKMGSARPPWLVA